MAWALLISSYSSDDVLPSITSDFSRTPNGASLLPEDLCSTIENAGMIRDSLAVGYGFLLLSVL